MNDEVCIVCTNRMKNVFAENLKSFANTSIPMANAKQLQLNNNSL